MISAQTAILLRLLLTGRRLPTSAYAVLAAGTALSVMVLCWLLAFRQGFVDTMTATGRQDQLIVLRRGANNEVESYLSFEQANRLRNKPVIDRTPAGEPLAAAEIFSVSELTHLNGTSLSVVVRGVSAQSVTLRPTLRVVTGRPFKPGSREVIVGRSIAGALAGASVGKTISLRGRPWQVTGIFESAGDARESEIWADAASLANAIQQFGFQSLVVRISKQTDRAAFAAEVERDPMLNHAAWPEKAYFARNASNFSETLTILTTVIGTVMALAACISSANSMLFLVERRRYDIGMLRGIGFRPAAVFVAVIGEGTIIMLAGALVGWIAVYALLDGRMVNTSNLQTLGQVAFAYSVDGGEAVLAVALACATAWLAGVWPARRAAAATVISLLTDR